MIKILKGTPLRHINCCDAMGGGGGVAEQVTISPLVTCASLIHISLYSNNQQHCQLQKARRARCHQMYIPLNGLVSVRRIWLHRTGFFLATDEPIQEGLIHGKLQAGWVASRIQDQLYFQFHVLMNPPLLVQQWPLCRTSCTHALSATLSGADHTRSLTHLASQQQQ